MEYNNDFRYDLKLGQEKEKIVAKTLNLDTIEIKNDLQACDTGNLYIEVKSRGKWSGISTTEATHWAYVLCDNQTILIETEQLKKKVKYYYKNRKETVKKGGDNNTSIGVLIPLDEFFITNLT